MSSFKDYFVYFLYISFLNGVFCGVPVLIWESSTVTEKEDVVPALFQLDVDEFSNHLTKKVHVHKPLIVVFLEETLSVEDFSWQDTKHKGAFPQIKNITSMSAKLEFIPSVDDPITSLKELMISHDYTWKKYDGQKLPSESGVILSVKLKDPLNNEDRPDLLRRHDGNIADIYSQLLAKHSRIVALYTGKQSSWVEFESNRVRREAESEAPETGVNVASSGMLLHSSTSLILSYNGTNITLPTKPEDYMHDSRKNYNRLILKFLNVEEPKKVVLRLKFPQEDGRWSFSEIEAEIDNVPPFVLTPSQVISEKLHTAFSSNSPIIFKDSGNQISLKFNDIKVQAYASDQVLSLVSTNDFDTETQYFTEGIWSGIIVTWVLGVILAWGIIMLLDVKTMDRFDDPKGKTITVNATD